MSPLTFLEQLPLAELFVACLACGAFVLLLVVVGVSDQFIVNFFTKFVGIARRERNDVFHRVRLTLDDCARLTSVSGQHVLRY
jgi:hypothetical protein